MSRGELISFFLEVIGQEFVEKYGHAPDIELLEHYEQRLTRAYDHLEITKIANT